MSGVAGGGLGHALGLRWWGLRKTVVPEESLGAQPEPDPSVESAIIREVLVAIQPVVKRHGAAQVFAELERWLLANDAEWWDFVQIHAEREKGEPK